MLPYACIPQADGTSYRVTYTTDLNYEYYSDSFCQVRMSNSDSSWLVNTCVNNGTGAFWHKDAVGLIPAIPGRLDVFFFPVNDCAASPVHSLIAYSQGSCFSFGSYNWKLVYMYSSCTVYRFNISDTTCDGAAELFSGALETCKPNVAPGPVAVYVRETLFNVTAFDSAANCTGSVYVQQIVGTSCLATSSSTSLAFSGIRTDGGVEYNYYGSTSSPSQDCGVSLFPEQFNFYQTAGFGVCKNVDATRSILVNPVMTPPFFNTTLYRRDVSVFLFVFLLFC